MNSETQLTVVGGGAIERDDDLEALVFGIWEDIVEHIKDVLNGAEYGYEKYLELADPSIDAIVKSITKIDNLMNEMLDGMVAGDLPIEAELKLIDCQQCVHLIRRVHVVLKTDDQEEYDDVIRKLRMHSSH